MAPSGSLHSRALGARSPLNALLLDLDGTLLDDRAAVRTAFAAFLSAHRIETRGVDAHARCRELAAMHWSRFARSEITFADQRRWRVRDFLGLDLSDAQADAAFEPYRIAYENAWNVYPECARFFELTAPLPKVVVTNGDKTQQLLKIQRCGLARHVVAVITPEDCGVWKPDHGMFRAAVERLGVPPGGCMMIGDDVYRDIEPARDLGLLTYQVDRSDPTASLLHAIGAA